MTSTKISSHFMKRGFHHDTVLSLYLPYSQINILILHCFLPLTSYSYGYCFRSRYIFKIPSPEEKRREEKRREEKRREEKRREEKRRAFYSNRREGHLCGIIVYYAPILNICQTHRWQCLSQFNRKVLLE